MQCCFGFWMEKTHKIWMKTNADFAFCTCNGGNAILVLAASLVLVEKNMQNLDEDQRLKMCFDGTDTLACGGQADASPS